MMDKLIAGRQNSSEFEADVMEEIKSRRSSRAYSTQPVERDKIASLFEAARWAPSSVNEQPWRYLYASQDEPELRTRIFELLNEGNREWAKYAPLLIVSLARKEFTRTGAPNGSARYDVGAANAFLSLQATALGLNVHQMGGFDKARAVESLGIPPDLEPVVVIAVGYPGNPEDLPEKFLMREKLPRLRLVRDFFASNQLPQ